MRGDLSAEFREDDDYIITEDALGYFDPDGDAMHSVLIESVPRPPGLYLLPPPQQGTCENPPPQEEPAELGRGDRVLACAVADGRLVFRPEPNGNNIQNSGPFISGTSDKYSDFRYRVNDGQCEEARENEDAREHEEEETEFCDSDPATAVIRVTPVNDDPEFLDGKYLDSALEAVVFEVAENSAPGSRVIKVSPERPPEEPPPDADKYRVAAGDVDGDDLYYSLQGGDGFRIVRGGELRTAVALDHETVPEYSFTAQVTDGRSGREGNSLAGKNIGVTVMVTDVEEPPATPAQPLLTTYEGQARLDVGWSAPVNTEPSDLTYELQLKTAAESWPEEPEPCMTGTTATSESFASNDVEAGTEYHVRVRACNDEGDSDWSRHASATAGAVPNSAPLISVSADDSDPQDSSSVVLGVADGGDGAQFEIVNGTLSFRSAPDFEDPVDGDGDNVYTVRLEATSGSDDRARTSYRDIAVTVTNVSEKPGTPAPPKVRSGATASSLLVSWDPVETAGPEIISYRLQYLLLGAC